MTIRNRLVLNILIILIGVGGVTAVSITGMNFIHAQFNHLVEQSTPFQIKSLELQQAAQKSADGLIKVSSSRKLQEMKAAREEASAALQEAQRIQETMKTLSSRSDIRVHEELQKAGQELYQITESRLKAEEEAEKAAATMSQNLKSVSGRLLHLVGNTVTLQGQFSKSFGTSLSDTKAASSSLGEVMTLKTHFKDVQIAYNLLVDTQDKKTMIIQRGKINFAMKKIEDNESSLSSKALVQDIQSFRQEVDALVKGKLAGAQDEAAKKQMDASAKGLDGKIAAILQTLDQESSVASEKYNAGISRQDEVFGQTGVVGEILTNNNELIATALSLQILISQIFAAAAGDELNATLNEIRDTFRKADTVRGKLETAIGRLKAQDSIRILKEVSGNMTAVKTLIFADDGVAEKMRQKLEMKQKALVSEKNLKEMTARQMDITRKSVFAASSDQSKAITSVNDVLASSRALTVGMSIGVVLLGIVFGLWMYRSIMRATRFAQRMAEGDLSTEIRKGKRSDELTSALGAMASKMREIIGEIRMASNQVASGSNEMNSSSQSLATGAAIQAQSAEEVTRAMGEITQSLRLSSAQAHQSGEIASSSARDTEEGGKAVARLVEAMREIVDKISFIEEIARTTNLLSLNASVEAARAGEHGKSFEVVAMEVRTLAEKTKLAAAEIRDLSGVSIEIAERSSQILDRVVPGVKKTSELVNGIMAASRNQTEGIESINAAIHQLHDVIQQNASASEELSATAEELSGQACQLRDTVQFFRTGEGQSASTA